MLHEATGFQFDPSKVSYHAVIRYVRCIIGISIEHADHGPEGAEEHATAAGYSVDDIKAMIYTPAVAAAISIGGGEFEVGLMSVVTRGGVVTTLSGRPFDKPSTRRLRIRTKSEDLAAYLKYSRRQRDRGVIHPTSKREIENV